MFLSLWNLELIGIKNSHWGNGTQKIITESACSFSIEMQSSIPFSKKFTFGFALIHEWTISFDKFEIQWFSHDLFQVRVDPFNRVISILVILRTRNYYRYEHVNLWLFLSADPNQIFIIRCHVKKRSLIVNVICSSMENHIIEIVERGSTRIHLMSNFSNRISRKGLNKDTFNTSHMLSD